MMVDFPEPDGAEKIMSFPGCMVSHYVEDLFFDLFEFVFHADDDF